APAKQPVTASIPPAAISRARPLDLPTAPPSPKSASLSSARSPGEIINDIQRELARRGYYDGPVDGVYGAKTDGAIREFESAAGLKPSTEPNEGLLQAIMGAPAKAVKAPPAATAATRPPMPLRNDAAIERPGRSRRVIA